MTQKKIFIAYDFNGVLDDSKKSSTESSLQFKIMDTICFDKVYRLLKLIDKYDASFFCISDLSQYASFNQILIKCLGRSESKEHQDFALEIKKNKSLWRKRFAFVSNLSKTDNLCYVYDNNKNSDFFILALEDHVDLTDECGFDESKFKHLWIDSKTGFSEFSYLRSCEILNNLS